jgi:hypothetical protein
MKSTATPTQIVLMILGVVAAGWPFFVNQSKLSCLLSPDSCAMAGPTALLIVIISIILGSFLFTFGVLGNKKGYALPVVVAAVASGLVYYVYFAVTLYLAFH